MFAFDQQFHRRHMVVYTSEGQRPVSQQSQCPTPQCFSATPQLAPLLPHTFNSPQQPPTMKLAGWLAPQQPPTMKLAACLPGPSAAPHLDAQSSTPGVLMMTGGWTAM